MLTIEDVKSAMPGIEWSRVRESVFISADGLMVMCEHRDGYTLYSRGVSHTGTDMQDVLQKRRAHFLKMLHELDIAEGRVLADAKGD